MKVVQINTFSYKSTGTIMMNIHKELLKQGYDSYVVWGRGRKPKDNSEIYMNDKLGVYFHGLYSRLTGKTGFASKSATKKLLKRLDEINPDVVHLHNIHGYYINIELLFNYLKRKKIRVIWTLHDCWSFTGQCPHFTYVNCDKWKTKCYNCPMISSYPKSFVDNSEWNYQKKKELFTGLDLTIVTPSKWLANLVKESFLKEYPVKVINNGIDTNIFKPTESDFREKYHLEDRKIILGVASDWTEKKGLNDFIELSKILDEKYKIVLVGLNKKQLREIPKNILGIERTNTPVELAKIYTAADVFFNPTYEDNYPTVNLEAIACGTPVLTYDTGGSPESSFSYVNEYRNVIEKNENRLFEIKKRIKNINLLDLDIYKEQISNYHSIKAYLNIYKRVKK